MIKDTIAVANQALTTCCEMGCVAVWRSFGSNIFFEFGRPNIKRVMPKTRKAFTVVRGEVSIGVHADDWRLRAGSSDILTADTVNDTNLAKVEREFFRGIPVPRFTLSNDGILDLSFARTISLRIDRNDYFDADSTDDLFDEVTVNFPNRGFRFSYTRGFYPVFD